MSKIAAALFDSSALQNIRIEKNHGCISCIQWNRTLCSAHYFHLFYKAEWSFSLRIACIFFTIKDEAVRLFGSLGSLFRIIWFFSPISHLSWKVFHQSDCSIFLPHLPFGFEGFSSNQSSQVFHQHCYQKF